MELLFVHLSDLHIKSNSQIDYNKAELIGRVVDGLGSNCKAVFFLISGDIAFSGAQEEYELAELFLKKIFEVINVKKIIITCAGNHDCDFNLNDNIRELVISELKKTNEVKSEYIEKVTTVFESYLKFSSKLCDAEVCNNISTIFNDQNLKVIIKTLNSSWMSHKEEMPGNAFFPIEELEVKKVRDQLSILIMHHPANWFIPEQQRDIRRLISSYNFVFTGHEHENGSYKIDDVPMIEGGELTPVKNNYNSSFNVVKYNTEMHSYKLFKYNFCKKSSVYVADNDPDWVQIGTGCLDPTLKFHLIAQFKDNLQDAGAPYRHPKKPTLTIDELFIYPDVQSSGRLRKKDNSSDLFLSLEKIFNDSLSGRYYIVGGERSGKSTICRKLFLDKFYCDNVPLLIRGGDISSRHNDAFDKIIKKSLANQYIDCSFDQYIQIERAKKFIIIDDFHLSPMRIEDKARFLKLLENKFDNIVVFVDEYMQFDDLVRQQSEEDGFLNSYSLYTIMPFGYKKRYDLTKKWYFTGSSVYNDDILVKIDKAVLQLDILVRKNFVPSYPFYLYTAISAFDGANSENLTESSYASYYNSLLFGTLRRIDERPAEISLRMSYLAELAYKIYQYKNSSITKNLYVEFHDFYCQKYQIEKPIDSFFASLTEAKILSSHEDAVFFKYKYFYYYFLAKYLSDYISQPFAREIILNLCIHLHMETSANVIMFLAHLSRDPIIIDCIIQQAQSLFLKHLPIRLEKDADVANKLVNELKHVALRHNSADKFRDEQNELFDKAEDETKDASYCSGKNIQIPPDSVDKLDADDLLLSLGAMFKTLDIIGLILKNNYGSLRGDEKYSLCEQGYTLPLRALADFFKFLNENSTTMIDDISSDIKGKQQQLKLVSSAEIEKYARQEVFRMAEGLTFVFIKKVAMSLASGNLRLTFKDVLKSNGYASVKLIDIAIKMDCNTSFPIDELKTLVKDFMPGHTIALSVLRDLCVYKMYMFNLPIGMKQAICEVLNISLTALEKKRAITHENRIIH